MNPMFKYRIQAPHCWSSRACISHPINLTPTLTYRISPDLLSKNRIELNKELCIFLRFQTSWRRDAQGPARWVWKVILAPEGWRNLQNSSTQSREILLMDLYKPMWIRLRSHNLSLPLHSTCKASLSTDTTCLLSLFLVTCEFRRNHLFRH